MALFLPNTARFTAPERRSRLKASPGGLHWNVKSLHPVQTWPSWAQVNSVRCCHLVATSCPGISPQSLQPPNLRCSQGREAGEMRGPCHLPHGGLCTLARRLLTASPHSDTRWLKRLPETSLRVLHGQWFDVNSINTF